MYFGNNDPALATFNELIPKINKGMDYWKQLKLTQIEKARAVEMFLASKLIYAMNFYPIPANIQNKLQKDIFDFINFPQKVITIAEKEMWKTKSHGGIKLINIQIKSETSKVKWLIEMASTPALKTNLHIFTTLVGRQKGYIDGRDLIFLSKSYMQHQMKTDSKFYKEALLAVSKLDIRKGIKKVEDWDQEHLFYNQLFMKENGKLLVLTKYCEENNIYVLDQLLEEKIKENAKLPFDKVLTNMLSKILLNTNVPREDMLVINAREEISITKLTQKQLYEASLLLIERDHHSQVKWVIKLNIAIRWEDVWNNVHNVLTTNQTKSIIWQQIHLNFYTQFSYNTWHQTQDPCPLCNKIPENIFHIILQCEFVNKLWETIEPLLKELYPATVTEEERAFGIVQKNSPVGIILRNWLTYLLRDSIMKEEREAYYSSKSNLEKFKKKFNQTVGMEMKMKIFRYKNEGNLELLDKVITHGEVLCQKQENGDYQIRDTFT